MKRKSGRKSSKKEEDGTNGVDTKSEQNGDASDRDEEEAPKKRKSSKSSRKSVSFSAKKEETAVESEESGEQDDNEDKKEDKKLSKAGRKATKKEETDESQESEEQDDEGDPQERKKISKKGNKKPKTAQKEEVKEKVGQESDNQDEDDETQYEVEAVLDEKIIKGVRHYLIRWKGYEEESDTWEPEDTLDCSRLIQDFKENKKKKVKPAKSPKREKKESKSEEWDENEAFEVDRILEVHHRKDGKREFLVSWKGYGNSDNSWEPEENMDCKDLIEKFMVKVERARAVDERELRVNRQHVQRYTLCTPDTGRRLSKRFRGKERVQYHDAE
ncbi:probable chromo domain-containing protein LHP1 [Anoplophora glabripennis]|uniref:probable chromo domain-containing protein LHP1 n=1 Tax=Anoplophora glabripennis TaxID=217634 RepID=UPI0008752CF3|nr:probable chromo domain-containing protein LHP1 [Anoplophora glabripennis]